MIFNNSILPRNGIGITDRIKAKIREHRYIRRCFQIVDHEFMTKIQIRERHKEWHEAVTVGELESRKVGKSESRILPIFFSRVPEKVRKSGKPASENPLIVPCVRNGLTSVRIPRPKENHVK